MKQLIISPTCFELATDLDISIHQKGVGIFKSTYPHGICRDGSWIGKEDVILYYNDGISNFTIDIDKDVEIVKTTYNVVDYEIGHFSGLLFDVDSENHRTYSFTIVKLGNIEDKKSITYEVNGVFNNDSLIAAFKTEIEKNNIFNINFRNIAGIARIYYNNYISSDRNPRFAIIKGENVKLEGDAPWVIPVLNKEHIEKLQSQCAAGKGFTDTANGAELYPSYMSMKGLDITKSVMYTLRFSNKRKSSKTRDEVVNQTIHIITQTSNDNLKYMFGF